MEGADGELILNASKVCQINMPQPRQRETKSCQENNLLGGSHFSGDVTGCESMFKAGKKKKKKKNTLPPQLQGYASLRQVVSRHGWKGRELRASLLPVQAAHLFPSAQH